MDKNYCHKCLTSTGDVRITKVWKGSKIIYKGLGICGVCSKFIYDNHKVINKSINIRDRLKLRQEIDVKECDHDWEIFENEGYKQCTYPECQIEQDLDSQDYEDVLIESQNFEMDQHRESGE